MHKPIMMKNILVIALFLFCLVLPRHADARLVLGAVSGEVEGAVATEQVEALAVKIAEALGDEVTVKWLPDTDSVLNWLDRFATLDLALFPSQVLDEHRGKFLVVGPLADDLSVNLVVRQGVHGDVPRRLADLVSVSGLTQLRAAEAVSKPEPEAVVEQAPSPVVKRVEVETLPAQVEPLPAQREGRTWDAEVAVPLPEIEQEVTLQKRKLVLGVVPDPTGVVRTGQQAEELAGYLEATLPVTVTVREFTKLETFAEWFMRYRMVDLAVISPELAMLNLGRDYMPLAKIYRSDKPGAESAELVVVRSGQDETLQGQIQQSLLGMSQSADGQRRMANLKVSDIFAPGLDRVVSEPVPVAIMPVPSPPVEPEPAVVEEVEEKEKIPELPEPVQPEVPETVSLPGFPAIVDVPEPVSVPETPKIPEPAILPVAPAEDITPPIEGEDVVAEPLRGEPVPTQPQPPAAPMTVAPPAVTLPAEMTPAPPVVAVPELPDVPEAPALSAEVPSPPQAVPAIDVPVPDIPQQIAVVPEMPEPPTLPVAEVEELLPSEAAPAPMESPDAAPLVEVVPSPPPALVPEPVEESVVAVTEETVPESSVVEERSIIEEVLEFAEPVSSHEFNEKVILLPEGDDVEFSEQDLVAMLGEDPVASMVAQPDLPQELRPTGIPVVRPGRVKPPSEVKEELLVASLPEPLQQVEPAKPPVLLPQPEPEPGIVYVIPFVSVMVPQDVSAGIFDQFIDQLNEQGENLGYQFLILKEGLQRVSPEWLAVRKYVTGEVYAYVEDRGATSTDLRSKARMIYRRPNQETAALNFEYPVRYFFNHDNSTLEVERTKMSKNIADTLSKELIKALQN